MQARGCDKAAAVRPPEPSRQHRRGGSPRRRIPKRGLAGRRRLGRVEAALGDVEDQPDPGADEGEVEEHLRRHHEAGGVGPRRDVAEAHRREDGDREVERLGVGEVLRERRRGLVRQREVDGGEGDQEHRDDDAERLRGAQLGQLGRRDAPDLPGDQRADQRHVGAEADDRPQAGLVADGQHEERTENEGPGEDDDGDRAQHGPPPLRLGEVGQADRRGRRAFAATDPPAGRAPRSPSHPRAPLVRR